MGIPLVASAIGSASGVAIAAVVNGMTVPFYISLSVFMMIRTKDTSNKEHSVFKELLKVFKNPVIITLFIGGLISFFKIPDLFVKSSNDILITFFEIVLILTKKLGSMGLPLALILVGSSLNFKEIKKDRMLLAISIVGKLFIAPLAVFLTVKFFIPNMDKNIFIALILLNAVPSAVASFIISTRYKFAEDFVSSMLVLSTATSIISIPIWLYIIL
jgi:predicted permease